MYYMTFKVLHGIAPEYLGPVVRVADLPAWSTGSSLSWHYSRLVVPPFKLPTSGTRAFSVAGPHVWNILPADITTYVGKNENSPLLDNHFDIASCDFIYSL